MDIQLNAIRLPAPTNVIISYPKQQGNVSITWNNVKNPDEGNVNGNIVRVMYNIYYSTISNGIFYQLNDVKNPIQTNRYEHGGRSKNPNTTYWYKVSTVYLNKAGKLIEGNLSSPIMYQVNNTNRWFKKINERDMWILKNTGQLFDLYKRKTDGKKCPKCYDTVRGNAGDGSCNICWGTGIEGGYEPVFKLFLRQKPAQTSLDVSTQGLVYKHTPGAWTISSVEIKNRDLLINPQGILFSVLNSNINQAAGVLFHQELQLIELDPNDPLYKMNRFALNPEVW
jgi:hypothetical protein